MIKVICEKCGAEHFFEEKEKGSEKSLCCLVCKSFFFKIDLSGKIIKLKMDIA